MNQSELDPQPSEQSYRKVYADEHGEYCLIPLTQGMFAKVDASEISWLNQWKWYAQWNRAVKSFYATRQSSRKSGPQRCIYMAREIMDAPLGVLVDHKNHDTLDCRRWNMRTATKHQNNQNARRRRDNKSGFKGVNFHKATGKWNARIQCENKRISLGFFNTAVLARDAYTEAAAQLHGEFACFD